MADLEDFFKKIDKKKKGEKKFTTVNTDELAENLDQMAVKEEMEKEISERQSCSSRAEVAYQSNKKKLDEQVIAEREVRETDLNMSGKNVSGKLSNTPEDVAAVELVFRSFTTWPSRVGKDGTWKVRMKNFSSIENIFHLALNVTETESKYSGKTTEVMTRITPNKKGNPIKLVINGITAVVEKRKDWKRERVVFNLRESGPTFSSRCPCSLRKSTSSPVIIRLSVNLKQVLASSQIMVKVERQGAGRAHKQKKERKASVVKSENLEGILQEDAYDIFLSGGSASSEEDSEEFLSCTAPQVITIGNEDIDQDERGGGHEESREADPKEASQRPRLKLLPRTAKGPVNAVANKSQQAKIFGGARPVDRKL